MQKTETEGLSGDDMAYGIGFNIPNNEGLRGGLQMLEIQQNFNPALGFVNRVNVRDFDANVSSKYFFEGSGLGGWFQSFNNGIDAERIHEIGGGLQSAAYRIRLLELVTHDNDRLQFRVQRNREVVSTSFQLFGNLEGGITIEPGDYTFDEYTVSLTTGGYREIAGSLNELYRWRVLRRRPGECQLHGNLATLAQIQYVSQV